MLKVYREGKLNFHKIKCFGIAYRRNVPLNAHASAIPAKCGTRIKNRIKKAGVIPSDSRPIN